jgi:hypothetical protein
MTETLKTFPGSRVNPFKSVSGIGLNVKQKMQVHGSRLEKHERFQFHGSQLKKTLKTVEPLNR